ncbi:uncharacterized protein [Haliotis asinina]|uniref:uncharacterized protein isoform X8 n=1 Tax=Haliotis asinina TaxID=109174 RepID=UPI0035321140
MFIETLEFTIPMDLYDVFSTLKDGPKENLEFPASVNSYGTTQDANIQVTLRSNKLTFVVDGVSSNASMISKSECKTLKLAVFDVDRTLIAQESAVTMTQTALPTIPYRTKRSHEFSGSDQSNVKFSRTSYSEATPSRTQHRTIPHAQTTPSPSNTSLSKSRMDPPVNVKQEPEDPDLIEIEPDPEPGDIVPKKETPYMQIDYSSDVPHTQTSQAALDRLSHPQSSHSQSPGSSSSSFHQNVPHVPDYSEPSTSQVHHGDQSADDYLVFQDDNDYGDDNEADYSNDGNPGGGRESIQYTDYNQFHLIQVASPHPLNYDSRQCRRSKPPSVSCPSCDKTFTTRRAMMVHKAAVHDKESYVCVCGKGYKYKPGLLYHKQHCPIVHIQNLSASE